MADTPPNIERFNRAVLWTLTTLYEQFPLKYDIDPLAQKVDRIIGPDAEGRAAKGQEGLVQTSSTDSAPE